MMDTRTRQALMERQEFVKINAKGRNHEIEKYKPSIWKLPIFFDKYSWRRKLLGKPNMYWLFEIITPYSLMQDFVYVFYGYMKLAVDWSGERNYN